MNERDLFLSALEIEDAAARLAHLQAACGGDAELLARVKSLLASHESQSQFLNTPVVVQIQEDLAGEAAATILLGSGSTQGKKAGAAAFTPDGPDTLDEMPDDMSEETPLDYLRPSSRPDSLGRLAHYEILEVLGRGAFGTVLKAFDEKLQRVVAIKVLASEIAATSPARKRFLREARASAAIRHENVVSIYAVDEDPLPYLVMEYIPGQTLQERLDERGPLDLANVLRLGKQIADGLAAAHAEQLIHRDVKPSNILLETGINDHVKITDFGLARAADDASVTQSGVIAGTPMYMSPEQAQGEKLDQRADLFSFGSVLYQMLSGRPPFRAPTTVAVLRRVVEDTPRPIAELIPEVPDWMCRLIGHLHAKNPDDRYGSAKEVSVLLAECLADLQAGRKPRILPPSRSVAEPAGQDAEKVEPGRSGRIVNRRHRVAAAVGLAILLLLAGLGIAEATSLTTLTSTVIRLTTGSGTLVIETDDPDVEIEIDGEEVTIRGAGVEELTLRPGRYEIEALKDGKPVKRKLVTITRNGRTVVRMSLEPAAAGAESGESSDVSSDPILRRSLPGHPGKVFTVAYSPDGRLLASGGEGDVRVWDARSGKLRYAPPVSSEGTYYAIVFSPDGEFLLTASERPSADDAIRIWEAGTGKSAGQLEGLTSGLYELSFSPDGNTLLSCGWEHAVRLWDFAERRKRLDITSPAWARSAVCSSSGKIAYSSASKVFLCGADGTAIATIDEPAGQLCFSPDGRRLAGTTWDKGRVTVWDGHTGELLASWRAHEGSANGVAFSRDGNLLSTAGRDGKVRLWDVESQRQLGELSHDADAYGVAFSPDGITLATGGYDRLVKLWDLSATVAQQQKQAADFKPFPWPKDAPPPAIAPFNGDQAKAHQDAWAQHLGLPVEKEFTLGQDKDGQEVKQTLVLIPPGEFLMGSTAEEQSAFLELARAAGDQWGLERISTEGPQHNVRITRPFWLGRYEVTMGQFRRFVDQTDYKTEAERDGIGGYGVVEGQWVQDARFVWNGDHGFSDADSNPVVFVSWNDANAYCRWLSNQPGGLRFSLPTEAQWEFACRAGTTALWSSGSSEADLEKHAWFVENSEGKLHQVGQRKPNGFGLFDLHGNVWEWCADRQAPDYFARSPANDPAGPETGGARMQRGGDWYYGAEPCRSASRHYGAPTDRSASLGFRVAAVLADGEP